MTVALSDAEVRALRMRAQLLAGAPASTVADAASRVCGVQSQSAGPSRLAVRARTRGVTACEVDEAVATRAVVRTWVMRGTLHTVAAEDVAWMVGLLGRVYIRSGRRRREQLGLDGETCERGLAALERILAGSPPLTRAQLVERLAGEGIVLDARSQAPVHLLAYAACHGLICRGPDAGTDKATYVLMSDWLGDLARTHLADREASLAELARRYLAGYGPATAQDFAAWSGLPRPEARTAFELIEGEVDAVTTSQGQAHLARGACTRQDASPPRLLGHFDTLLLGYQSRDLILDRRHARRIQAGGGFVQPAVLVAGRVVGTWKIDRSRRRPTIVVSPFVRLPASSTDGLEAEAADMARFLGTDLTLELSRFD